MSEEKKNMMNEDALDEVSGGQSDAHRGNSLQDFYPRKGSTAYIRGLQPTGKVHAACLGAIIYSSDSEKPFYYCEKCEECHWTLEEFTVLNLKPPTLNA